MKGRLSGSSFEGSSFLGSSFVGGNSWESDVTSL